MPGTSTSVESHDPNARTGDIAYCYGQSSLGDFLAAVDDKGLCAILLGDDQVKLLDELRAAFPGRKVALCDRPGCCNFVGNSVAYLIDVPGASAVLPISIRGGDFKQMVHAALKHIRPGTTVTPEELAVMIGAAASSASHVRAYAAADLLAVAALFHRLQEQDGTSPAYRWGEER